MLRLNLSTVVKKVKFKAVDGSKGQKPLCYLHVTANFCWRIIKAMNKLTGNYANTFFY